jgi:hypothetical protein
MTHASLPLKVGVLLGFLFFAHALIPHSNAWPLVWPFIAGALVVVLAAREGRFRSFGQGMAAAVKTGAVAGLFFFAAGAVTLLLLSTRPLEPVARLLGAENGIDFSPAVLVGLAIAALIGVALAALSGAAAYPLASRRRPG